MTHLCGTHTLINLSYRIRVFESMSRVDPVGDSWLTSCDMRSLRENKRHALKCHTLHLGPCERGSSFSRRAKNI
jgi:hypothetical protein